MVVLLGSLPFCQSACQVHSYSRLGSIYVCHFLTPYFNASRIDNLDDKVYTQRRYSFGIKQSIRMVHEMFMHTLFLSLSLSLPFARRWYANSILNIYSESHYVFGIYLSHLSRIAHAWCVNCVCEHRNIKTKCQFQSPTSRFCWCQCEKSTHSPGHFPLLCKCMCVCDVAVIFFSQIFICFGTGTDTSAKTVCLVTFIGFHHHIIRSDSFWKDKQIVLLKQPKQSKTKQYMLKPQCYTVSVYRWHSAD